MKTHLAAFIEGLISYDYILFGGSFVLFLLFIILGIILRKKLALALIFIFLAFGILLVGPTYGYIKLHETLFKHSLTLTAQKKLEFTKAVIVWGSLSNDSSRNFKECKISVSAYSVTKNKYKNYLTKFKPFIKRSIVEENIAKGEKRDFKIIVDPFTYSRDYNISLGADCR